MSPPSRPVVLLLHPLPAEVMLELERWFDLRHAEDRPLDVDELTRWARVVDGLIPTVTDPVPASVFATEGRRLRIVANYGVGVERIDVDAAEQAGVIVTNTPEVLTDCTADLTIALMLMTLRRLGEGERLLRAGAWTGWRPTGLLGARLSGKTLGIIGMGRIGQAVARRAAHGFGMRILYHTRSPLPEPLGKSIGASARPLESLLTESDVVSLHCPLTPETRDLLDARRLTLMRPDAVVINTARGALIDESALAEAIAAGRLAGAGLDVYRDEPNVPPALGALDRVVLLPHLGSATLETRTAMGLRVVENLRAFFEGREPPDAVRPRPGRA